MSLLVCPECGGKVSSMAASCPHCGCPVQTITNNNEIIHRDPTINPTQEPHWIRCPVCHAQMDLNIGVCEVCQYVERDAHPVNTICLIQGKLYDLEPVLKLLKENKIREAQRKTSVITKLEVFDADALTEEINRKKEVPTEYDPYAGGYQVSVPNVPKCPVCGSTNLVKQGIAGRAVSGFIFGGLSVEGRAQWICKNCGHMF